MVHPASEFERGRRCFDEKEFFEAHEIWEELWHEASGARHAYLQCIIQVAVAMHHASRENWNGTRKLLASALGYLDRGRSEAVEVDMDVLRDRILDFELALQDRFAGKERELPFFPLPMK